MSVSLLQSWGLTFTPLPVSQKGTTDVLGRRKGNVELACLCLFRDGFAFLGIPEVMGPGSRQINSSYWECGLNLRPESDVGTLTGRVEELM